MKATRLLFIAALVGCGERAPTGVPLEPLVLDPLAPGTALLRCAPLSPDSVSQTIGPLGGVLLIGPHRLSIPSGALDTSVTITAVAPPTASTESTSRRKASRFASLRRSR